MFWRVTAGLLSVLGFPDLLIWHLYLALIGIEVLYMKSSTFELYILFSQYRPHDDYEGTSFATFQLLHVHVHAKVLKRQREHSLEHVICIGKTKYMLKEV